MKSNGKYIVGVLVLIILGGLVWSMINKEAAPVTYWNNTSIKCLPGGHTNLALHIHPDMKIFVDGVEEVIPANIGLDGTCMAEVHTHDATGKIHIETAEVSSVSHVLGDFFTAWGKSLERDGFVVTVTADGVVVENPLALVLKDHQQIAVNYQKKVAQ